jgi:hypothetical protein
MHHLFRLGPLELEEDDGFLYVAFGDGEPVNVPAPNDAEGVALALEALAGKPVVVDPQLALAGAAHGLKAEPLPPALAAMRASLRLVLALGEVDMGDSPDRVLQLGRSLGAYYQAAPWRTWHEEEPVAVELSGKHTGVREAVILGGGGEEFGLAVYDKPGAVKRLYAQAEDEAPLPEDATTLLVDDWVPASSLEPLTREFGLEVAPRLLRLTSGGPVELRSEDLELMAAIVGAVAQLRPSVREATHTVRWEGGTVTAKVKVGPPQPHADDGEAVPLGRLAGPRTGFVPATALCDCGSGKRFGGCHGQSPDRAPLDAAEIHKLLLRVHAEADEALGEDWAVPFARFYQQYVSLRPGMEALGQVMRELLYSPAGPGAASELYLMDRRSALPVRELDFLLAQRDRYFSAYRVTAVGADGRATLVDQLADVESAPAHEDVPLGLKVQVGDGVLARLYRRENGWAVLGLHPLVATEAQLETVVDHVLQIVEDSEDDEELQTVWEILSPMATLLGLWEAALDVEGAKAREAKKAKSRAKAKAGAKTRKQSRKKK